MAVDMTIKIEEPALDGESKLSGLEKQIDVLAWSFGVSQSGTMHMGEGGTAGKANVQDISITKYVDAASPNLALACCNGKHYDKALLTVRKAGEKPVEYLKITMKEVIISSYSTGGSGGEDRLTENVSLNFAEYKTVYTPQDPTGKPGAAIEASYNIAKNVKV